MSFFPPGKKSTAVLLLLAALETCVYLSLSLSLSLRRQSKAKYKVHLPRETCLYNTYILHSTTYIHLIKTTRESNSIYLIYLTFID